MNLVHLIDCWRDDDEFSENDFCLIVVKEFWYDKKNFEVFWRIYLNIIFGILLSMLTSLVIWNLNNAVSTTLKYCYK